MIGVESAWNTPFPFRGAPGERRSASVTVQRMPETFSVKWRAVVPNSGSRSSSWNMRQMEVDDDYITLYTAYEDFGNMVKMLEELKIECESAELQRIPNTTRQIDEESMRKVLKVISMLEEDDDVTNVFHDMEIPEDFEEE